MTRHGGIAFRRSDSRTPPVSDSIPPDAPLELVVPFTDSALTAEALSAALELTCGINVQITLMAVAIVPFPAPMECPRGIRQRLEAQLRAVARTQPVPVRVKVVCARGKDEAFRLMLPGSLVVIATRKRLWRTPEERLGRKLIAAGHRVSMIRVD